MELNFENVQMAVAIRESDNMKIDIGNITEKNRYEDYKCVVCGSKVIPVAPDGKRTDGNNAKVTPHFKHFDAESCGRESFEHFWCKTEFIKIGDKFKIITDKENEFTCSQIQFETPIDIDGKKYIPDATITTSCGSIIHFEYGYSNTKKIKDYIDIWSKLNNIIVEVDLKSISGVFYYDNFIPTFNALYYKGKCFNLNTEDEIYYKTIGEYKLTKYDKKILEIRKDKVEALDWLWDEIKTIKYNNKDYDGIGDILHSIDDDETRSIAIDMLSKIKCGNSILNNYISYLKDKLERRMKLFNLKHDGYLIKYKIKVPKLIYDRIFKGLLICLYSPYGHETKYQTYDLKFSKHDILNNTEIKKSIEYCTHQIKKENNLLLKALKILQDNEKVIEYKLHYKIRTDYIDAIYFKDYRGYDFILHCSLLTNELDIINNDFNNIIKENSGFIEYNNYILIETNNSYRSNRSNCYIDVHYDFDNLLLQKEINLSYLFDEEYTYLPKYDFVKVTSDLIELKHKVDTYTNEFISNIDENIVYKDSQKFRISDKGINKKLKQVLYPMIYISNNSKNDCLNIRLNKDFTKGSDGRTQGWLIKDFIKVLEDIGICDDIVINNIK